MSKTTELREALAAKQADLAKVFDEAGPDLDMDAVKTIDGDSHAKVEWIRQKNAELESLHDELREIETIEKAKADSDAAEKWLNEPTTRLSFGDGGEPKQKSVGELWTEHPSFGQKGVVAELPDVDVKTVMSTGAGWAPETTRSRPVVPIATQPIEILDLVPTTTTDQVAIVYMEETTFTNAAAEVAESVEGTPGTYPESALALTERSDPVKKIATWIPASDEQLEDEPQARNLINNRLPFMLRQRLQTQLFLGDGLGANLEGIFDRVGVQTYALTAEPVFDAIHKGITLVRVTGRAEPDAIGMHPNDWQDLRLTRTADGIYILGNPGDAIIPRLWGLPVEVSTVWTENTGYVGDFGGYSELAIKRGIEVQVTNTHDTFFIEGKQAIRADMRAAVVVYRPAAFCTVTGI